MAEAEASDSCDSSNKINSNESADKQELNKLVSDLSTDYAKFLKVDVKAEKTALEDEMEDILTRLDEHTSLVDMVRGDNALCLNGTLPSIHNKCGEIENVFAQIDKLGDVLKAMSQSLDVLEKKVSQAEEELDSSSMKKIFSSFQKPLFSKKSEPKKQLKYDPPEIFKTEDFFPNMNQSTSTSALAEKEEKSS